METHSATDKSGWITVESREGQTVGISLDASGTATDAELQIDNTTGLKRIVYGEAGETDASGNIVGTVILNVTVSESGYSNTVYQITITRTLVLPFMLTSLTLGTQPIDLSSFTLGDTDNVYTGIFELPHGATLTGLTLSGTASRSDTQIKITEYRSVRPAGILPCQYDMTEYTEYHIELTNENEEDPVYYEGEVRIAPD